MLRRISFVVAGFLILFSFGTQTFADEIPGVAEGLGTVFTLSDLGANIEITSTAPVDLLAEYAPGNISLIFGASAGESSAGVKISGLEPDKTYYKYEDDYHNLNVLIADASGSVFFDQDLLTDHLITIQTRPSTKFLRDDATGGDCTLIGAWDAGTKTCTLNRQVNETIEIDASAITLDGGGFSMGNGTTGSIRGIYLPSGRSANTIRNISLSNFSDAIYLFGATSTLIENVTIASTSNTAIFLTNGANNNIIRNVSASRSLDRGLRTFQVGANTVESSTFDAANYANAYISQSSNITFTGNTFSNSIGRGFVSDDSQNLHLRANRFQNNLYNFYVIATGSTQATVISRYTEDIDTSNLVGGKPLYYLVGAGARTIDAATNAGALYCISCSNVSASGLDIGNAGQGIVFINSTGSSASANHLRDVFLGLVLNYGSASQIVNNVIENAGLKGIGVDNVSGNTITGNHIDGFSQDGIRLATGANQVRDNVIENGVLGIFAGGGANVIQNNRIISNSDLGIEVSIRAAGVTVSGNVFAKNRVGVRLYSSNGAVVTGNLIAENTLRGITLEKNSSASNTCLNNKIYSNDISGNATQFWTDGVCPLATNALDNAAGQGNYWIDYDTPAEGCLDADANTICDAPRSFGAISDRWPSTKLLTTLKATLNEPPVLSAGTTTPQKGIANITPITLTVTYTDPDNNPPTSIAVNIDGVDHAMTIASGGQYAYTSTFPKGVHQYYFTASDGEFSVRFPVAPATLSFETGYSNVLFLPGLEASRLFSTTNPSDRLWEPNTPSDVRGLYLNRDGTSVDSNIKANGVIDEYFDFAGNVYKSFITKMNSLVADGTIHSWRPFDYDWRHDLSDIVENGVETSTGHHDLVADLETLAAGSATGKVVIVGHSNGGLLGKMLISKLASLGKADLVEQFIMVATPQLGTPKAASVLLHGEDPGWVKSLFFNREVTRTLAENMTSGYNLAPSAEYFNRVADPVITFNPSIDTISNFRSVYGNSITSRSALTNFLLGTDGRVEPENSDTMKPNVLHNPQMNASLANQAILDSWTAPAGIKVSQIVGWGLDTISGVEYTRGNKKSCSTSDGALTQYCVDTPYLDHKPIYRENGDGTVVAPSAKAMPQDSYFLNLERKNRTTLVSRDHSDIFEVEEIRDMLKNLFTYKNILPQFITTTEPSVRDASKRLRLQVLSPVSIDLYDSSNKHTGINGSIFEKQIPNSYYEEFGEGKYLGLDTEDTYTVKLQGLDYGTFTFEIDEVQNDQVVGSLVYQDVPVSPTTKITMTIQTLDTASPLQIDTNGDGQVDQQLNGGTAITPIDRLNTLAAIINSLNLDSPSKKSMTSKINDTISLIKKGNTKGAKQKLGDLQNQINAISGKKLTQELASELITIVETIKSSL